MTNNDQQNTTLKTKDLATRTSLKTEVNSNGLDGEARWCSDRRCVTDAL